MSPQIVSKPLNLPNVDSSWVVETWQMIKLMSGIISMCLNSCVQMCHYWVLSILMREIMNLNDFIMRLQHNKMWKRWRCLNTFWRYSMNIWIRHISIYSPSFFIVQIPLFPCLRGMTAWCRCPWTYNTKDNRWSNAKARLSKLKNTSPMIHSPGIILLKNVKFSLGKRTDKNMYLQLNKLERCCDINLFT